MDGDAEDEESLFGGMPSTASFHIFAVLAPSPASPVTRLLGIDAVPASLGTTRRCCLS